MKRKQEEELPPIMTVSTTKQLFEPLPDAADERKLAEDLKNIKEREEEQKEKRLKTVDDRLVLEQQQKKVLDSLEKNPLYPKHDEISIMRRERAMRELYKNQNNPTNVERFKEIKEKNNTSNIPIEEIDKANKRGPEKNIKLASQLKFNPNEKLPNE